MKLINKALIEEGLKLESNRRNPPLDSKNLPVNFNQVDQEYQNWLRLHGYILLTELQKHLK
jgi:hypothetical protein